LVALLLSVTALAAMMAAALPAPASAQVQEPLTVTLAGNGTGSVDDSSFHIICPTTCTANFDVGAQVVLTADAGSDSTFAGWSGAGCAGTGSCIISISAATDVVATFNEIPPPPVDTLRVQLQGSGTGSVHDTNFNISCPSTCSGTYSPGDEVVLVAEPDSGSSFGGWSGAGCSGTGSCIVTLSADTTVTALFLAPGQARVAIPRPKRGHHRVRALVRLGWRWSPHRTILQHASFTQLPPRARITLRCHGPHCPFRRQHARRATSRHFARHLAGTTFHPSDQLTIIVSAPHLRSERARITFPRELKPIARLLR
jgi:hypothetical protein